MAAILSEINAGELMQRMTLKVRLTGFKRLRIRAWLGAKVIALGVAIIGCNADITDE